MFESQGLAYSAHRNVTMQHKASHKVIYARLPGSQISTASYTAVKTSPVYHSNSRLSSAQDSHPALSLRVSVGECEAVQVSRVGLRLPGLDQTADVAVDPCPRAALGRVSRRGGPVP